MFPGGWTAIMAGKGAWGKSGQCARGVWSGFRRSITQVPRACSPGLLSASPRSGNLLKFLLLTQQAVRVTCLSSGVSQIFTQCVTSRFFFFFQFPSFFLIQERIISSSSCLLFSCSVGVRKQFGLPSRDAACEHGKREEKKRNAFVGVIRWKKEK